MLLPAWVLNEGSPTSSIGSTTSGVFYATRDPPSGGWSSLIGIITAIIGNVLISFALNTQRYAHIQLQKEAEGWTGDTEQGVKNGRGRQKSYGTLQSDIADERAKLNAQSKAEPPTIYEPDGHQINENEDHVETEALIPSVHVPNPGGSTPGGQHDEKLAQRHKTKSYLRSPYWWLGIALMVVGEAGNFLAYGFAPASIVSPLGVVALIVNCIIAPIMLKERFRKRDLLGVLIAVGGAVTVVLSAKGSNPKLGPIEIGELMKRWEFLTYLGITIAAIIALMLVSSRYGHKSIVIDIGLVGLFGGYTALSTKGVASLMSYRLWHVLEFPITYLLVVVLVFTAIMQIKYLNRALQHFDSTQVIPTQFVAFTVSVVTGSAILYRDFEKTTADKLGIFLGGVVLTFLGVWCITGGRDQAPSRSDAVEEDEDATISLVDDEAEEFETEDEISSPTTPQPRRSSSDTEIAIQPTGSASSRSLSSYATASSTIRPTTSTPEPSLPPQHPRTTSTPTLPLSSQFDRQTLRPPQSPPRARPGPSPRSVTEQTLTPGMVSPQRRDEQRRLRGVLDRNSSFVERMFSPGLGPLTSPLSGSLAAVVANSLRKTEYAGDAASGSQRGRGKTGERSRRPSAVVGDGAGDVADDRAVSRARSGRRPSGRRSTGDSDAISPFGRGRESQT